MQLLSAPETNRLVDKVIASGLVPSGGVIYHEGQYYQAVVDGTASPYDIVDGSTDVAFNLAADAAITLGMSPLGDAAMINGRIVQAFGTPGVITDTAAVMAVIQSANRAFRASFTTTGAEITQLVTVANTPQAVTFNSQPLPNAALGTLNNATGVFTVARDFDGVLSLNAQIRRGLGGNTTWALQLETSTDGVVWTPAPGSNRRVLFGAGETNLVRFYDFTLTVSATAGSFVRFTQMVSDATNNTGLVALAAGLGGTTSAGFIFSMYSLN